MSSRPSSLESATSVHVELGPRSYEIRVVTGHAESFGAFVRDALDRTWAGRTCQRALLVTDENVSPLAAPYVDGLRAVGITPTIAVLPPGEATKSLDRAADLFDDLVKLRADRHTCIVALGGGVIGDLAGFVAATYARGLPLLMIPTTLLAQVDSAVGGKVGVNHPRAKNIIGAFHQPVGVWVDTETLATLPDREIRCGLAEVVKYGVILDAEFFAYLEQNGQAIVDRESRALRHIVAESCRLKAEVVTRDEREETGLRAVLNFGHTIGHAIESITGYGSRFQHGEAVAAGMVGACHLAEQIGWVGPETTARIVALLEKFGLPIAAPGLDAAALLDAMGRDKKNQKGKIRFILPRQIGRVELTDAPDLALVRAVLSSLVGGNG